jgi:hypothetical protein
MAQRPGQITASDPAVPKSLAARGHTTRGPARHRCRARLSRWLELRGSVFIGWVFIERTGYEFSLPVLSGLHPFIQRAL